MDPRRQFEHQDTSYQSFRTDANLEKAKVTGAHGAKNKEENKGYGDQDQPIQQATTKIQQIQDDDLSKICAAFSELKLQELDRVFQRTQFPSVFRRKERGMQTNVGSEAETAGRSEPEYEVPKQSF
ncbi:uncharacterized protein LOC143435481 [Arvicanthis niloticus]|uniref:uncharacterized protein LOC143309849 n=1 Tax=Arvicanthis niloticus TaxID=61156 RepID=UPI00402BB720